ncbi:hypothetical protein PsorP6_005937 [Peronosclerospora sorghi]|uniref:Uncharacterized protein n=1 Tax=Peronosclerospora sorghi TaxID=230839 RepID=A0ACC0W6G3_9STRA|nr:hypothetical protein PsorP6_005937 [Peronosclerospora sorghi]
MDSCDNDNDDYVQEADIACDDRSKNDGHGHTVPSALSSDPSGDEVAAEDFFAVRFYGSHDIKRVVVDYNEKNGRAFMLEAISRPTVTAPMIATASKKTFFEGELSRLQLILSYEHEMSKSELKADLQLRTRDCGVALGYPLQARHRGRT